jgi:hypothetical protein
MVVFDDLLFLTAKKVGKKAATAWGFLMGYSVFTRIGHPHLPAQFPPSPARAVPTLRLVFHTPRTHTSLPHQLHNGPHHQEVNETDGLFLQKPFSAFG